MFQVIRTRNKEIMDVQSCFLSTTLQIWCYCVHVIKSRTIKHLNFGCQLNLSKSHRGLVIIPRVVSAQCRKVWLGGGRKTPPPPCEIGLKDVTYPHIDHIVWLWCECLIWVAYPNCFLKENM